MGGWSGGVYTRFRNWVSDKAASINPQASLFDQEDDGFAAGLNNCVTKDGLNKPSAAMDWNGQNLSGVLNFSNTGTVSLVSGKITVNLTGNLVVTPTSGSGLDLANNNNTVANPSLRLMNSHASAQTMIDWFTNGTISGRFRNDSTGSMTYVAFSTGTHAWFVGGDSGTGTNAVVITAAGILRAIDQTTTLQDVGWRDCPQNLQSSNYTCVLGDRGKQMMTITAGITFTIPANASVAYPLGTVLTFCNTSGSNVSVAITTDQMIWAGTGSTVGTRTLANSGVATAIKTQSTQWLISGSGLS